MDKLPSNRLPLRGGPSYQQVLDADSRAVPPVLRELHPPGYGALEVSVGRYISPEFFRDEIRKVWLRTWQMACREEDIPEVGDCHLYEVAGKSLIVVRSAPDEVKALHNSCLHRGRKLLAAPGSKSELRCPYHGFCWALDGSFRENPMAWDFPHCDDAGMALPEAKVGRWGGFVFVNFDRSAPPLEQVIDPLPRHFAFWPQASRYKAVHVAKVVRANWKVVAEAFMESHHSITTHPQILPFTADANSQYDILSEHVTRHISAAAMASPFLSGNPPDENAILGAMLNFSRRRTSGSDESPALPPGVTARAFMAEASRKLLGVQDGADYSGKSDAEMLDSILYNVFPNLSLWAGIPSNLVYRWRPNGLDHASTIMDVMILKPVQAGSSHPKAAPVHMLGEHEPWSSAAELGALGGIFDQDMGNLPFVQEGLVASEAGTVRFGAYSEGRIAHHHRVLDSYLNRA